MKIKITYTSLDCVIHAYVFEFILLSLNPLILNFDIFNFIVISRAILYVIKKNVIHILHYVEAKPKTSARVAPIKQCCVILTELV